MWPSINAHGSDILSDLCLQEAWHGTLPNICQSPNSCFQVYCHLCIYSPPYRQKVLIIITIQCAFPSHMYNSLKETSELISLLDTITNYTLLYSNCYMSLSLDTNDFKKGTQLATPKPSWSSSPLVHSSVGLTCPSLYATCCSVWMQMTLQGYACFPQALLVDLSSSIFLCSSHSPYPYTTHSSVQTQTTLQRGLY